MARKADLPLPTHSGRTFTWTGNKGVVEASTLGRGHTGRVWRDACDVGSDVYAHRYVSQDGFTMDVLCT